MLLTNLMVTSMRTMMIMLLTWWWPAPKERRPSLYSCSGCWYASLLSWNKMPWWKAVMDNGKILQQRKYTRLLHHQCLWQSKRIANHLFFNKGAPAGPVRHDRTPPWLQLVAGHLVQVVFKVIFKCGDLSHVLHLFYPTPSPILLLTFIHDTGLRSINNGNWSLRI